MLADVIAVDFSLEGDRGNIVCKAELIGQINVYLLQAEAEAEACAIKIIRMILGWI